MNGNLSNKTKRIFGIESSRSKIGITVSYWENLEAITCWNNIEHSEARNRVRDQWN